MYCTKFSRTNKNVEKIFESVTQSYYNAKYQQWWKGFNTGALIKAPFYYKQNTKENFVY